MWKPAWEITNGEYVTVAVIDQGVDRDHEDMGGRVLEGYTVGDPAGKGTPQNPNKYKLLVIIKSLQDKSIA